MSNPFSSVDPDAGSQALTTILTLVYAVSSTSSQSNSNVSYFEIGLHLSPMFANFL